MKESFEIFINSRDTFVNIPVDEDQTVLVPDPESKILNTWSLTSVFFSGQPIPVLERKLRLIKIQSY